jgi:predicted Rossmann fold flavoprotein
MSNPLVLVIVGGGAAGFFAAITAKLANPQHTVIVLEKSTQLLKKVRISGGGRCNVTHACFDPKVLSQHYPRGGKELIGPFHRFQPRDTVQWFAAKGVQLKTEKDGRMFPITDNSQTIINCLLNEAQTLGVEVCLAQKLDKILVEDVGFRLFFASGENLYCQRLLLATGSSPQGYQFSQSFGHTLQEPVPSLFTFNVPASPLKDLAGIAVADAEVAVPGSRLSQRGPLLITHWGFSGPAALKLSAWGARYFHENAYQVKLAINWLPKLTQQEILMRLHALRSEHSKKHLANENPFDLPKNLWKRFLEITRLAEKKRLADTSNGDFLQLCEQLVADVYQVNGKTTYKEEFVTCGGINLKEIDFRTMGSRLCPNLFFAGEILDIDGITGGFNFQNAWTTAWLAGQAMAGNNL